MLVTISQALDLIHEKVTPLDGEIIPIEDSVGRVALDSYCAQFNLPRFDNSAMDGYAVKVSDAGATVRSTQVIYAGDNPAMELRAGQAIRIMTGAPVPKGCEAIVPIEEVTIDQEKVTLPGKIKMGNFIRLAGEDIAKGTSYLHQGEVINAYSVASLASQGVTHITVSRRIKVAIFGTGDELRPHFEKIEDHQLYNSNSPMFLTRCKELGCEVRFIRSSVDTLEALQDSIASVLDADIIITSGGVSVGDKDFTKEAFTNLGMQIHFQAVDIKPGRPTVFGTIGRTAVVNLPGNPLASMVNYELFLRAIIRKMSGRADARHATITTFLGEGLKLKGGKTTALLGTFDGESFTPLHDQKPGMVSPMQKADGMILLSPQITELAKNSTVKMIPIRWEACAEKSVDLMNR
ncbi:gephyrin-like molybdotransferase Glp [Sulfurovum sp.]|jgi:molybdopterin molybdotransferase|uniref:molybdopterin molybdotransferase MoeA n=1 Tax=Sulfurovum sp. TaxID=1969726 RepID=UPI002A36F2E9|nr:gephyrin-like molybdotransferase Glp [Sulfurovum sp.]MDD2451159.1 molybdopterin molybdotransferase MoeA [Sulfurovum sp.]MDD3499952.1 molybdopterin molybdotransferase MoeA [Sulfurovum sp.]MDY0403980.1 molybdopterin molybdotransferase MoeA [Sulfurovum sp.]